jgi:hypothetical protein
LHHVEPDRAACGLSRLQVWYRRNPARICSGGEEFERVMVRIFQRGLDRARLRNRVKSIRHCPRPWSISGGAEFHLAPGGNPVQTNFAHRNQKWRVSRGIRPAGFPEPVETGTEHCRREHGHLIIGRGTRREGCPLAAFIMWAMRGMMPEIARCGFSRPAFRFDSTKRLGAKAALLQCPRRQFERQMG